MAQLLRNHSSLPPHTVSEQASIADAASQTLTLQEPLIMRPADMDLGVHATTLQALTDFNSFCCVNTTQQ